MTGSIGRAAKLAATILVASAVLAVVAGTASATLAPIYNNIASPLAGNYDSVGFDCCQVSEFGGAVAFEAPPAGKVWKNPKVTVTLSSWACQVGTWSSPSENCKTTKGAKFGWPITFSIYEVGPGNSVGSKIAAASKEFKIPYRPSASSVCKQTEFDKGGWYDKKDGRCYNGFAAKIALRLKVVKLPPEVIVSVAYNTSSYGAEPQNPKPCNSTEAGCPYDSLNVAMLEPSEGGPTLGTDPTEDVYVNTTYSAQLCVSGTPGTFGPASCPEYWEGAQPLMRVDAEAG